MESKIKTESPYIEKAKKHVGETYNELTIEEVVGMEYRNGTYRTMVRCRCSCGKEIIAMLSAVFYGHIRSCGHRRKNNFDKFYDGFVDYIRNGREDEGEAVIVWRGPWHNDGHATMNLNKNEWDTNKS